MNSSLHNIESLSQQLNDLYAAIRKRDSNSSIILKEKIDLHFDEFQKNSDLALHYHLIHFRYNFLLDNFNISKDSFDVIDTFDIPLTGILGYYYTFFKAIYFNAVGNYIEGKAYFYKAKELLHDVPDELEYAEFHYMLAISLYDNFESLLGIKEVLVSKKVFLKNDTFETNVAFCNNLLGLMCTDLKNYELAADFYYEALHTFQKLNEENWILMVQQNLGFMYSEQELTEQSLHYLSKVNKKVLNNYKVLFVEAKELFKLGKNADALDCIERGVHICKSLHHEEYLHHFNILQAFVLDLPGIEIEEIILKGKLYFEKQNLTAYNQRYFEQLAHKYKQENEYFKSCECYSLSYNYAKQTNKKEVLSCK
ncbi:hypothetical protein RW25_06040 [Bacillus sp. L_1B0_8]|uniref:response regulator aspartate phosphatase n=1 Tax=unclassified Bacillus (in: firmicutes) TaxID=185979 RepID=UPI0005B6D990|nr:MULTISPECIES: hypothetical protein [unclassified Bacillus (in: firmicutes)]KIQ91332.1 hypothetical protein RW25_06040 [Bacillus sp. L_1B0_8]KIQ91376.1 hypothetical protein RT27_02925 [Bacillus sp. L_1B0_5]